MPSECRVRIGSVSGCCFRESVELSLFGDELRCAHESAPGRARQRPSDTHASYTQCSDGCHVQIGVETHQQIDRSRRDRGNHGADVLCRAYPRSVQAVGAGVCIGLQSGNDLFYVGLSYEKALGTADQHGIAARFVDRCARRANPHHRLVVVE
jgi:hypothetical protein